MTATTPHRPLAALAGHLVNRLADRLVRPCSRRLAAGRRRLGRLRRDRSGAIMAEFAICLPLLMAVLVYGVDLSRLIIASQKMDRVAAGMGDLVAQAKSLTSTDLANIYAAVDYVARPFDFDHDGVVIISSVSLVGSMLKVNWQSRGAGNLNVASKVGVSGGRATLPSGMTISDDNTVIVAEVYFNFTPIFNLPLVPASQLYHTAFFRPRLGDLDSLN
jgi:Flp pilus assembly protein TadG